MIAARWNSSRASERRDHPRRVVRQLGVPRTRNRSLSSYCRRARIAKRAAMIAGRYAHAKQSTAIIGNCACCGRDLAASSATSAARSSAEQNLRRH
jgi:hypothetical protein